MQRARGKSGSSASLDNNPVLRKLFNLPKLDPLPTNVTREQVLSRMRLSGEVSEKLVRLLRLPSKLHITAIEPEDFSFSSNPKEGVGIVAAALLLSEPFPPIKTEYGIAMFLKGDSVYCMFVDKTRKVAVLEYVCTIYDEKGSWKGFEDGLSYALSRAAELKKDGTDFRFVVCYDGKGQVL